MLIAWIGLTSSGGDNSIATRLLCEIDKYSSIEVHCYVPGYYDSLPLELRHLKHITFICETSGSPQVQRYTRYPRMSWMLEQMIDSSRENRLIKRLLEVHRNRPYDVVHVFLQGGLSILHKYKRELPPICLHPVAHPMGELRWYRRETHLVRQCDPWLHRMASKLGLLSRVRRQNKHLQAADRVLAGSEHFANSLVWDYSVSPEKIRILPSPVDLEGLLPNTAGKGKNLFTLLFVSQIAVGNGIEMIVELSHRLNDLVGQIEIVVAGDKAPWSDYTPLLRQMNTRIGRYIGPLHGLALARLYQSAHILMQPGHDESFGMATAKAIASGTPVVASDQVGMTENVSAMVCRVYQDGNVDDLECEVRKLLSDLRHPELAEQIYARCRQEAERLYSGANIAWKLAAQWAAAKGRGRRRYSEWGNHNPSPHLFW